MENPGKKLILHALTFGLYLTAALVILQLMTYIFEFDIFNIAYSLMYQLITLVVIVWTMAYASVKFRNKYLGNNISFLRCFLIGLIAGLLAAILISLYSYVFNVYFDPEYSTGLMEKSIERIDSDPRIPDEQKEVIIKRISDGFTPSGQLVSSLLTMSIMNTVLALIATLFVRKKEKQPETNVY